MTTLTRFVPFRSPLQDAAMLQNRLQTIFNDFARPGADSEAESLGFGNFVPPVDVYEDPQRLLLKVEVPGIREDDLNIHIENRSLTIRGERKLAEEEKEENFHRIERRYGSFTRTFTLPSTVDTDSVQATYEAGVLSIALQKKEAAKPKQIKIGTGSTKQSGGPRQVEASSAA